MFDKKTQTTPTTSMLTETPFSQDSSSQDTELDTQSQNKGIDFFGLLYLAKTDLKRFGSNGSNTIFKIDYAGYLELRQESFLIGRGEGADWIITNQHATKRFLDRTSNNQCRILKDCSRVENPVFIEDLSRHGTFLNDELIGFNEKRILKTDDVISFVHPNVKFFRFMNRYQESYGLPEDILQQYHIGNELGKGAEGIVRQVTDRKTCKNFALKIVKRNSYNPNNEPDEMKELKILSKLTHPNIVKCYSYTINGHYLYMFLDYMEGGDLQHRIRRDEYLSVNTTKHFFLQLCSAVKYLHDKGYVHRNIKPENILLQSQDETQLKLSDFGLIKKVLKDSEFDSFCGTPAYMAPEIRSKSGRLNYTNKVDVWSSGAVLYFMLSGSRQFETTDASQCIAAGNFHFKHAAFRLVPEKAKDLIRKMLTVNPNQRPSIDEVLMHPWLNDENPSSNNELNEIFDPEITQPPSKRRRTE